MEEDFIYQIKIKCLNDTELIIYTNGRKNDEIEVLNYVYQKYWEHQPDISKYKIISLSEEPSIIIPINFIRFNLAHRAFEYADMYN